MIGKRLRTCLTLAVGLALLAVVGVLATGSERPALAGDRWLERREAERAPVSEEPGYQYGNEYYRNCLRRRQSGDLRCGETCFWRECVRCQNICRMHCSCDDCPDDDDGPPRGGGDDAAAPDLKRMLDPNGNAVSIVYQEDEGGGSGIGGVFRNVCPVDVGSGGDESDDQRPGAQSPKGTRVLPTQTAPVGPVIGVGQPCDRYEDCPAALQNQIEVHRTGLLQNFGASNLAYKYRLGDGKNAGSVTLDPPPFALTFVVELKGTPEEGLSFPCAVRWQTHNGGRLRNMAYDSWYGDCRAGYVAMSDLGRHDAGVGGLVARQGFIAEVQPSIGSGSEREHFSRWLWPEGRYRVQMVLDPGTSGEYVLAERQFRVAETPDENPHPRWLTGFSEVDPRCPDCRTCGCDSRYGCDCDADSDCGCDCGGSCYCTSRCGDCIRWEWRGIGPFGSGRCFGTVDRGDSRFCGYSRELYSSGFNQEFRGVYRSPTEGRYWYANVPDAFQMAGDVGALVDHNYGAASRCQDARGVLTEAQEYRDDSSWGVDPITREEESRYGWLERPSIARTPVAQRTTTPPTPTLAADLDSGEVVTQGGQMVEVAPELARRRRFAACEETLRERILGLVTNRQRSVSYAVINREYERVRDRSSAQCVQPSPWPSSAPSGWDSGRIGRWNKDVWSPALSAGSREVLGISPNVCLSYRTGYHPGRGLSAGDKEGLIVIHWDQTSQRATGAGNWSYKSTRTPGGDTRWILRGRNSGVDTGMIHAALPSDGATCWLYDFARGRWETRRAERMPGSSNVDPLVEESQRTSEVFLGFIDSRPAPHLLVERPVVDAFDNGDGCDGMVLYGPGLQTPWVSADHRRMVEPLARRVLCNFEMAVNVDRETDLCGSVFQTDWGQDSSGNRVLVRVQVCWMRYSDAKMLPWVVKDGRKVPHTVEVVTGSHPELPSGLGSQSFPMYRHYGDGYSDRPVSAGGVAGSDAAGESFNSASCLADGSCYALAGCAHLDHRGMLRTSYTLQHYPQQVRESAGTVRVRYLEDQNGRSYRYLLVYPSNPRAPAGTDAHHPDDASDGQREHDRALKLNSRDFRRATENGQTVLYVDMPVIGPGTYDGGTPVEVRRVRMPWAGYERIAGGSQDGWLRYTASDGDQTTINPALLGNCQAVCPYVDPDASAAGRQTIHHLESGATARYTKQMVVGLYGHCSYEPAVGKVVCADGPYENAGFSDLPFPYCPVAAGRPVGTVGQCDAKVRTEGQIRTMESYVVPAWRVPAGRTVRLGGPCTEP